MDDLPEMTAAERFQFERDRDSFATQLRTLHEMGYQSEYACTVALRKAYGNVSAALDILERDAGAAAGRNGGTQRAAPATSAPAAYPAQLRQLMEMGWDRTKAVAALDATKGNVEAAVEKLLAAPSTPTPAPGARASPAPAARPALPSREISVPSYSPSPSAASQRPYGATASPASTYPSQPFQQPAQFQSSQQQPQAPGTRFVNDLIDLNFQTPVSQPQPDNLAYESAQYRMMQGGRMGPVSGGTGMVGMGVGSASAMGQGYGPMPRPGPLPTSEANVGYSAPGQYGAIASSGPGSWGGQGFDASRGYQQLPQQPYISGGAGGYVDPYADPASLGGVFGNQMSSMGTGTGFSNQMGTMGAGAGFGTGTGIGMGTGAGSGNPMGGAGYSTAGFGAQQGMGTGNRNPWTS